MKKGILSVIAAISLVSMYLIPLSALAVPSERVSFCHAPSGDLDKAIKFLDEPASKWNGHEGHTGDFFILTAADEDLCDAIVAGTQCADAADNDSDGLIDANDPGCWTDPADSSTYDPLDDDEAYVIPPSTSATLTVIKQVVNEGGGALTASDFSFSVNGGAASAFEADGSNELSLAAGTYTVTEPAVTGYAASYSNCADIALAGGSSATCTITNTYIPVPLLKGSVSGQKFNDLDGDGAARKAEEPFLTGWTIRLYNTASSPWTLLNSAATDDAGYSFTDIPEGSYKVCEVMQSGWTQTFPKISDNNASPSASLEGPKCQTVNIDEDGETNTRNFGNHFNPVEPVDVCPNLDGAQATVPAGYSLVEGQCVADPIACETGFHLEGEVCVADPIVCYAGFHLEEGVCVADPVVCGEGYHLEGGSCVLDAVATDVCANIDGAQDSVPAGYHRDGVNCVLDAVIPAGGGSGGGGSLSGGRRHDISGIVTTGSGGEVLGAYTEGCSAYLEKYIRQGIDNDPVQVMKLQEFLNGDMGLNLALNGVYDDATLAAVNQFQAKYAEEVLAPWNISEPTGIVYLTSLRKINMIACSEAVGEMPELVVWSKNPHTVKLAAWGSQAGSVITTGASKPKDEAADDTAAAGEAVKKGGFLNSIFKKIFKTDKTE